jgi:predicted nuclease with TOPRIM domain
MKDNNKQLDLKRLETIKSKYNRVKRELERIKLEQNYIEKYLDLIAWEVKKGITYEEIDGVPGLIRINKRAMGKIDEYNRAYKNIEWDD